MFHTFLRSSAQDLRNAFRGRGPGAADCDCEAPSSAEGAPQQRGRGIRSTPLRLGKGPELTACRYASAPSAQHPTPGLYHNA